MYRYRYVLFDAAIVAAVIWTIWQFSLPPITVVSFLLAYLGMRHTVSRQHDREQRELAVRILLENAKFHTEQNSGKTAVKALPVYRTNWFTGKQTGEIIGARILYSDGPSSESDVFTTPTFLSFMFTINPVVTRKQHVNHADHQFHTHHAASTKRWRSDRSDTAGGR